jgi:SAM-dependent methyltransferase
MTTISQEFKKNRCPVCDTANPTEFAEIRNIPVFCNMLWDSRQGALEAATGNIRLCFCHTCGHVYNAAFDPGRMQYNPRYETSLHYSPAFRHYVLALAKRLVSTYALHEKDVLEIGCGQGDFLRLLADLGNNRCIGFDPSYDPRRNDQDPRSEGLTVIQDYYSEQYSNYPADFLACRQVLEHIREPRRFLEMIRRAADGRKNALIFVEVPNVMFTLKEFGIWDLIYEHYSYFTSLSLSHLFIQTGFNPLNLTESFGGQYLCIEATPLIREQKRDSCALDLSIEAVGHWVNDFAENYRNTVMKWAGKLAEMRQSGIKPVVWGAGSKGITFLNVLKSQETIDYVVDINPHKQGLHVPGTGQQVISAERMAEIRPDAVIAMNPLYLDEIRQMIADQGLHLPVLDVGDPAL